jgi:hypothetical protein
MRAKEADKAKAIKEKAWISSSREASVMGKLAGVTKKLTLLTSDKDKLELELADLKDSTPLNSDHISVIQKAASHRLHVLKCNNGANYKAIFSDVKREFKVPHVAQWTSLPVCEFSNILDFVSKWNINK